VQPEAEPAAERLRYHVGETVTGNDRGDRLGERARGVPGKGRRAQRRASDPRYGDAAQPFARGPIGIAEEFRHVVEPHHIGRQVRVDHQDRSFGIGQGTEVELIRQWITVGAGIAAHPGIDRHPVGGHGGGERADVVEQDIERRIGQPKHPQERLDHRLLQLIKRKIVAGDRIRPNLRGRRIDTAIGIHGLLRCCRTGRPSSYTTWVALASQGAGTFGRSRRTARPHRRPSRRTARADSRAGRNLCSLRPVDEQKASQA
jgi:hypothetical protein